MRMRAFLVLVLLYTFAVAAVWGQSTLRLVGPSGPVAKGATFEVRVENAPPGTVVDWQWDGDRFRMVSMTDLSITLEAVGEGTGSVTATGGSWAKRVKITVSAPLTKPAKPGTPASGEKPSGDEWALTAKEKAALAVMDEYRSRLGDLTEKFGRGGNESARVALDSSQEQALRTLSESFFKELGALGFSVNPDLINLKSKLKKLNARPGESPLQAGERYWNESYLPLERALMMGRAMVVQDVWNRTLVEYLNGDPEKRVGVIYGEIDIGSWVSMHLRGLAFDGDIDFSSVATACDKNLELRALFERNLKGATNQSMGALDAFLTAHGDATKEVFVGEWGKTFAEFDFLKRGKWKLIKPILGADGRVSRVEFIEKSAESLFWERAFRTGQPFDPPKVTLDVEPMLSLEMLRHIAHDVESGPFSRGDKIKKIMKYAERSYFYNKKAGSEFGWNPYDANDPVLAKVADAIVKNKENPGVIAEELTKLTGEELTNENVDRVIEGILERAKTAVTRNAERGLSLRLQKIAAESDEKSRNDLVEKLWSQMRDEIKAYNETGLTPPEHLARALDLALALRDGAASATYVKNLEKLRSFLMDTFALPGNICDRLFTSDSAMRLRRHLKEKLQWSDEAVEKCVRQLKEKYPDLGKVCDAVVEFNNKVGRLNERVAVSTSGSALLRCADFADNAFALYDAYYSAKDRNAAYYAVSEQMVRIGIQEKWPWAAIPLGVYDSLKTRDPRYLAMAVTFYYFPLAGQVYMVSQQCQRLDVAINDALFASAMDEMRARARFDENGRISAFLFYRQNIIKAGRQPDLECEVSPPGNRDAILKIARSGDIGPAFETEPGFAYWASLVPGMAKGDYYSYVKKLESLQRFFAYSDDVYYLTVMLKHLFEKADTLDADQRAAMLRMEEQLEAAVWMAMADALESAERAKSSAKREEWDRKIAGLERELSFRSGALKEKINWEMTQRKSVFRGEDLYSTGLIYEKYINAYTEIKEIIDRIWSVWYDFDIDVTRAFTPPCKHFLGGGEGRFAPLLTGDTVKDLAAAQKCLKNHAAVAEKARTELASALGREVDRDTDRKHLKIVGQLLFEWELLRSDSPEANLDAMQERSKTFRAYLASLRESQDLQKMLTEKASIVVEGRTLIPGKPSTVALSTRDEALLRDFENGALSLAWSADAEGEFEPANTLRKLRFTPRSLKPVTLTVVVENKGARRKGSLRATVSMDIPREMVSLTVTPREPEEGGQVSAALEISPQYRGRSDTFSYRWRASNCAVENENSPGTVATAPASGSASVTCDLFVEVPSGQSVPIATRSVTFTVKKKAEKKPVVKKPVVKKPEVKKPVVKKPEVKKPVEKKPEVKEAAGKKPVAGAGGAPDEKGKAKPVVTAALGGLPGTALYGAKIPLSVDVQGLDTAQESAKPKEGSSKATQEWVLTEIRKDEDYSDNRNWTTECSDTSFQATAVHKSGSVEVSASWNLPSSLASGGTLQIPWSLNCTTADPRSGNGELEIFGEGPKSGTEQSGLFAAGQGESLSKSGVHNVSFPQGNPGETYSVNVVAKGYAEGFNREGNRLGQTRRKRVFVYTFAGGKTVEARKPVEKEAGAQEWVLTEIEREDRKSETFKDVTIATSDTSFRTTEPNPNSLVDVRAAWSMPAPRLKPGETLRISWSLGYGQKDASHGNGGGSLETYADGEKRDDRTRRSVGYRELSKSGECAWKLPEGAPGKVFRVTIIAEGHLSLDGPYMMASERRTFVYTFAGGKAVEASRPVRVIWQSEPGITFLPPTSDDSRTMAQLDRMGKIMIWAIVQVEKDGVWQTVCETAQSEVDVTAPRFVINYEPAQGAGRTGQQIKATVAEDPLRDPPIDPSLIEYIWTDPATSNRMEYTRNGNQIGFRAKDTNPLKLSATARVPKWLDTIAEIDGSYVASLYSVRAEVLGAAGPKPQVWKEGVGLVTVESDVFCADEMVRVRATLEGEPRPADVRWRWRANEGTTIGNDTAQEIIASRHETGTAELTVEALDKDGALLGKGAASFPVTVTSEQLKSAKVKAGGADAEKKRQQDAAKLEAEKKRQQEAARLEEEKKAAAVDAARQGDVYSRSGEHAKAIECYTRAIELAPGNGKVYVSRGNARRQAEDYRGALADLDEGIRLGCATSQSYTIRGAVRILLDDWQGAREDFSEVIRLDPSNHRAYHFRALVKVRLNDFEGGLADAKKALALDPGNKEYKNQCDEWERHIAGRKGASSTTGAAAGSTSGATAASGSTGGVPSSGLRLWLKADAGVERGGDGKVAGWADQSGNGFDVTQPSAAKRPLVVDNAQNGCPAIQFDGVDDYLETPDAVDLKLGTGRITYFVVVKPGATQKPWADIWDYSHQDHVNEVLQQNSRITNHFHSGYVNGQQLDARRFQVFVAQMENGKTSTFWLDGDNEVRAGNVTRAYPEPNYFTVGNKSRERFPRQFNGAVAEIVIYNSLLDPSEMQAVGAYLQRKYAIAPR